MKKVRITVVKKARHDDLIAVYELPQKTPCFMHTGDSFLYDGETMPEGFCPTAWESVLPFARALSCGAEGFFGNWMKDRRSAMVSCNDGFRPVSFLLQTADE